MFHPQRRRFVLASLFAAIGAAHARSSQSATRDTSIALVLKNLPDPFTLAMISAAKVFQAHAPYPFRLTVLGIQSESDAAGQIRLVDTAIKQGVNAIVLAPSDSRALVNAASRSVQRGILTLAIDNPFDADALHEAHLHIPYVGPNDRRAATRVGDYVAHRLHAGDRIGIIEGVSADLNAQQRTAGFRDAMQAAQIEVAAVETGNWEYGQGRLAAASILAARPGIRALLCANDNMARGAVDAVRESQLTGRVLITGFNASDAIKPMIEDGRVLASLDQFAQKQAVYGLDVALQACVEHRGQNDLPDYIETPVTLVTKDTL